MKKALFIFLLATTTTNITAVQALTKEKTTLKTNKDSLRVAELDLFWAELSRTVREGDFEGYAAAYHEDAVIVFATKDTKTSIPITKALSNWKQGFLDTKSGKNKSDVTLRFSQRIGDDTTAHETGIFKYTSSDSNGQNKVEYRVHFEMLFVKRNGKWLGVMEYQKSYATKEEWDALKN